MGFTSSSKTSINHLLKSAFVIQELYLISVSLRSNSSNVHIIQGVYFELQVVIIPYH